MEGVVGWQTSQFGEMNNFQTQFVRNGMNFACLRLRNTTACSPFQDIRLHSGSTIPNPNRFSAVPLHQFIESFAGHSALSKILQRRPSAIHPKVLFCPVRSKLLEASNTSSSSSDFTWVRLCLVQVSPATNMDVQSNKNQIYSNTYQIHTKTHEYITLHPNTKPGACQYASIQYLQEVPLVSTSLAFSCAAHSRTSARMMLIP